jgi:hypothetical protein
VRPTGSGPQQYLHRTRMFRDAASELPDYHPRTPDGRSAWSMIAPEYTRTNKFTKPRRQAFTN